MAEEGSAAGLPRDAATVAPGTISALLAALARAPEAPDAWEPEPGTAIGRFELVRKLGAGGFGVVWLARDHQLRRDVAFKLVRPGESLEQRGEALVREAEAAAQLSHDNLVPLYDAGRSEWGPYLVQELLRGETLAERQARGRLPLREALRILVCVARGVAHAHASGVVHRDLKPGNVFLCEDGRVKVLDFGLAHAFGRRRSSGGTPGYMAPEQLQGLPEDERTDVFALGVMLFELISGRLPFEGKRPRPKHAPVLEVKGQAELGQLVSRLLARDPLERPRDGAGVRQALEERLSALERSGDGQGPAAVRLRSRPGLRLMALVLAGVAAGVAAPAAIDWISDRPTSPVRTDGRVLVAIADVVNETEEHELNVLSGLLVTSLEQSPHLEVMTQARVLDLALQSGRKGLLRVDEATGREVARRAGAAALLLPAVRKLGATYSMEMRAIDPVKGRHLFTVSDRAGSKEGMFGMLDRLSEQARLRLHEDAGEIGKERIKLAEATTRSLEAYQRYVAGIQILDETLRYDLAIGEFEEAVRLDPGFAMAHASLAYLHEKMYGPTDVSRRHQQLANSAAARLPAKERAILGFLQMCERYATPGFDEAAAVRAGTELEERYPNDAHVLGWLVRGWYAIGKNELREKTLRRLVELDPTSALGVGQLLNHLVDRPAEALAMTRRAVELRRTPNNLGAHAEALRLGGDRAGSEAMALEALRLDGGRNHILVANTCILLQQRTVNAECRMIWERLARESESEVVRDYAEQAVIESLLFEGRRREALRRSQALPQARRGPPRVLAWMYEVGLPPNAAREAMAEARRISPLALRRAFLAGYGLLEEAAEIDAKLQRWERSEEDDLLYQGFVLSHRGQHAKALEHFRKVEAKFRDVKGFLIAYEIALEVASEALAAGRPAEALAVEPIGYGRRVYFMTDIADNYPRFALVRARAFEQEQRPAEAVKELDGLIDFWKNADEDLPLLVEARALRAKLAADLSGRTAQ